MENELVTPSVLQGLKAVTGLRYGRSKAKETETVKPVPDAFIDAVLPHVSPVVAAMIQLQRFTGMRSGEVLIMRGSELNMTGKVWIYSPAAHKNAHRGHERRIYLGPKAQEIIRPFLKADLELYLFSPADTLQQLNAARSANRKTPLSCGNIPGSNRVRKPNRKPGELYNVNSYRRAVVRGIEKANKALLKQAQQDGIQAGEVALNPHWHLHQLRHNAATFLRRQHGIEKARIILGHRSMDATAIYAETDEARAIDVMGRIG